MNKNLRNPALIGFIGQGWIGKNYADDFENRGYKVIRYALEEPYINNKEKIKNCDIVFIAVPTPTTPAGFDDKIIRNALQNIGKGKIAVIKSTLLPGTTEILQKDYPDFFIFHSPEFLREISAAHDAANPSRNIIGLPIFNKECKKKAQEVLDMLPRAPYEKICHSRDAEIIKYAGNSFLYLKVVFANLLYDLAQSLNCNWDNVFEAVSADSRIGPSHLNPIHHSRQGAGIGNGRGAGGDCFIKDYEIFLRMYENNVQDEYGNNLLRYLRAKNIDLLLSTEKDIELLKGVYGEEFINNIKNQKQNKNLSKETPEINVNDAEAKINLDFKALNN